MNSRNSNASFWFHRIIIGVLLAMTACVVAGSALAWRAQVRAVPVLSGSMNPAYGVGALVLTKPERAQDLETGDVIAFRPPSEFPTPQGRPIMHRITSIDTVNGYLTATTKGDANPAPDPWKLQLDNADVHGAWVSMPTVGRIVAAMTSSEQSVRLTTIAGSMLLCGALFLRPRQPSSFSVACTCSSCVAEIAAEITLSVEDVEAIDVNPPVVLGDVLEAPTATTQTNGQ